MVVSSRETKLLKKIIFHFFFCSVQVQKKTDKQNEELLSDGSEENDSSFWKSLTRSVGPRFQHHPSETLA